MADGPRLSSAELRALNAIDPDPMFARFIRRWRKLT